LLADRKHSKDPKLQIITAHGDTVLIEMMPLKRDSY